MNWKNEVERVNLEFDDVTFDHITALYEIGEIQFSVEIDYFKTTYDHEIGRWSIDIEIISGKWTKDGISEYYPMEFGPEYKDWMLNMIENCMDEFEFLSEYTWGYECDEWSLYGI